MLCGINTGSTVHHIDKRIWDYLENLSPQIAKNRSRCTNKKTSKMSRPAGEYDAFQPCFFEADLEDQDFYDAPAPSEDIWKKFELLPTPPRSPKHEPLYVSPCTLDKLQMVSDILDSDSGSYLTETSVDTLLQSPLSSGALSPGAFSSGCSGFEDSADDSDMSCAECCALTSTCLRCVPLGSKLIQDCMWSGLNLPQELKSSNLSGSPSQKSGTLNRSNSTCSVDSGRSRSSLSESCDTINSADCVDPTAVFPFPVNECSLKNRLTPALELQTNLGAETPSDSEDEEIDVVTVGEKKVQYQKVITTTPGMVSVMTLRKRQALATLSTTPVNSNPASPVSPPMSNSSMCAQVAAMHNYTAAPSSEPTSCSSTPSKRARVSQGGPSVKRIRINAHADSDLRSVVRKLHSGHSNRHSHNHHKSSSRSSSDSEDSEGRRAQHNVLERKRRNDLKSSFHTLRDRIPELSTQERAPKVVILKKATDYIWSLRRTHSKQQSELEHLQRTQDKLRRQLAQLQAS